MDSGLPLAFGAVGLLGFAAAVRQTVVGSRSRAAAEPVSPKEAVLLDAIFVLLQAEHRLYWTLHWQASGSASYGDHLLFQRLYQDLVEEIDHLAERLVGQIGPEAVAESVMADRTAKILDRWTKQIPTGLARGLFAEQELLAAIQKALEADLSAGTQNLLQQISDKHEEHVYLLKQRTRRG